MLLLRLSVYLALIDGAEERNLFEQIYWEYEGLMLHRAKEILQDDMQAEDAVHAAFLQIARNMATVGQVLPDRRKALVMRILENAAIDSYRKQKRERSHVAPMTEAEDLEQPEHIIGAESPLALALVRLPLEYRQAVLLKYAHGYDNKEIARLLGFTVSKVEKLLSRGKKKLWQLLQEVEQE